MRILLLVPMAPQAEGAGAIPELLSAQVEGLARRHELTVVGTFGDLPGQAEAAAQLRAAGIDARFADRRRSRSAARRRRVQAELAASWLARPWPWRAVTAHPEVQGILDRALAEREFDLVAVEEATMTTFRLPPGLPRVLTEHEAVKAPAAGRAAALVARPRRLLAELDRRRWERFQRRAWERFGLIQVYGEGDAAAIGARAPQLAERVRVNPFGVGLPPACDPAAEEPGTLLFFGTFTHPPNVDAALWLGREIMPALRRAGTGARLLIVGKAPPREVRALAGPDVEVVADAPSMRPHLERAAVVLAPVRSGGGMRMKVLRAMASRKAVVTTRLGAEGFTALDPEPPLALAEGSEQIVATISALLSDPAARLSLATRARAFAERHHTPEAWADRLERVYAEAAGAQTTPSARP